MNVLKMTSFSLIFGVAVPYYFVKDCKSTEITKVPINGTIVTVPVSNLHYKIYNIINYSAIGVVSGLIIGNFI